MKFPVGIWGRVRGAPATDPGLAQVRIERVGSSFLILTREPGGEFDTWVEREADVVAWLARMQIDWPV